MSRVRTATNSFEIYLWNNSRGHHSHLLFQMLKNTLLLKRRNGCKLFRSINIKGCGICLEIEATGKF
jgi:hypothetical protein